MKKTTLCYIRREGHYLLLYRNKKKNDPNAGKWVGIGGKTEDGETPDEANIREIFEETGIRLLPEECHYHGIIRFISDKWEAEEMYLYSADISGTADGEAFYRKPLPACDEGDLAWIEAGKILDLPMWEGDRCFLTPLLGGEEKIFMTLRYEGERLAEVVKNSE